MCLHFFAPQQKMKMREAAMNQPDEMDLTLYLQTEGRRLAAELARQQPFASRQESQQQCAAAQPGSQRPARSLSEALQRMGIAGPQPQRRL
jgi:hypothetical protein